MKKVLYLAGLLTLSFSIAYGQQKLLPNGTIADRQGKPISGATIHILNTTIYSSTDVNGRFSLPALGDGRYALEITATGYATIDSTLSFSTSGSLSMQFTLMEDIRQLDAVTVWGEKKENNLQTVPFSISAIKEKAVREYRIWNTEDLTAIIPNLYSANPGDGRNITSIRGIVSTSYDPAVTTTVDGVSQFSLDTYIPQLFDVASIEVVRGTQGSLYGRNATGGVINITTKQPTNKTDGFAELNLGNFGAKRITAGIRTALIKNKLYFGAAGLFHQQDGFYTNDFNQRRFEDQQSIGGNYYLKYIASPNWSFTINAKHLLNENQGAFPLASSAEEALANPFRVNQDAVSEMKDNTFNGSLAMNYTGRGFNFSSQSAYQSNYRYYTEPLDGDFSPIDGITIINNFGKDWNTIKVYTQEFKFSSPATVGSKLQWVAGAYFFHHLAPNKQATHFGKDAVLVGSPDIDYSIINTSKLDNKGAAVFGQADYAITEKLRVKAGMRFDYQRSKAGILGEYQPDASPVPLFETRSDTSGTATFNAFSPTLSFAYQPHKNTNWYATYSRGFRSGGLTQLSPDPSQAPLFAYQPEYSNNFELGSKNQFFNNRLRLNVAVFYNEIANAQVPTLVLPEAFTITKNAGRLTSKGMDASITASLLNGLEATYNIGYTDAAYQNLKVPQNGQTVDLEGNKQIYTPDITSMLALQYTVSLQSSGKLKLVARGEWAYLGQQYFDLTNNIRQSPYQLLNTRIGFSTPHYQLFFWGRNITDQKYIAYAYDFGAAHLGNPATYGVTLRAEF